MDRKFILSYLETYYPEVIPKDFYRSIFPIGELEDKGHQEEGRFNGIAVELLKEADNDYKAKRYFIHNGLEALEELLKSDNFIILSPISYAGRSREAKNARYIYAIAIDLDGITEEHYLRDLFYQIDNEIIPKPTYIVWSGTGVHLYYQLAKPVPCYKNITKQLYNLKRALTKRIWNKYITELYEKPQIQSLFQGFRMVGTVTKGASRTKAFEIGSKVTIDYLNSFVAEEDQFKEVIDRSNLTLAEAKDKYPEWYDKRIINKKPKGTWTCKVDLYNWWLNKLKLEITSGHRYYGIMCLACYAKKCGIERSKLEADAFSLLKRMEQLTVDENNHFTSEDILSALEMYNDSYITFPIDTISQLTAIPIEKNKRNGLKQKQHLYLARRRKEDMKAIDVPMKNKEGRPTKEKEVKLWREAHPDGSKAECIRELNISKPTVYKYWSK